MIGWELLPPPGEAQVGWLDEIREFRARVLYDNGRRPGFRQSDGRYADGDRLDRAAHHLFARIAGVVAGCVRLLPVPDDDICLTEQLFGPARFAEMLRGLGVKRSETIEGGRWIVDPTHRTARLGVLLAAGGVAVARALGYRMLCCPAGTRRKQDRVLSRLGFAAVPGLPLLAVPQLDDDLRMMHVFTSRPAPHFRELMDTMAVELKLSTTHCVEHDQAAEPCAVTVPRPRHAVAVHGSLVVPLQVSLVGERAPT
jgi:N-acyl-L-homoserine lactone synthetase